MTQTKVNRQVSLRARIGTHSGSYSSKGLSVLMAEGRLVVRDRLVDRIFSARDLAYEGVTDERVPTPDFKTDESELVEIHLDEGLMIWAEGIYLTISPVFLFVRYRDVDYRFHRDGLMYAGEVTADESRPTCPVSACVFWALSEDSLARHVRTHDQTERGPKAGGIYGLASKEMMLAEAEACPIHVFIENYGDEPLSCRVSRHQAKWTFDQATDAGHVLYGWPTAQGYYQLSI